MRQPRTHPAASGFSLIELMVAIAIIAMLAAFAVPSYRGYLSNTHETLVQNQYRDATRFARSKAAQYHMLPISHQIESLPADAAAWIQELNPQGHSAPRGGPAYVPGAGDPETGAIGIELEGSVTAGTAVLRVHRPAFGSLEASISEVAISAW